MKTNDGGPAFPVNKWEYNVDGGKTFRASDGATLRQIYAGLAIAGLLADPTVLVEDGKNIAALAFVVADAMLAHEAKEREGK